MSYLTSKHKARINTVLAEQGTRQQAWQAKRNAVKAIRRAYTKQWTARQEWGKREL